MAQAGTSFLIRLTTKLISGSLGKGQQIAHLGDDDVLDRGLAQHRLQSVGEILDDDDGAGPGVDQLMLQLARGIERIDVHHSQSGPQGAEQGHRILQDVGHHDGDSFALAQTQHLLQKSAELAAEPVDVAIAQGHAHVGIGRIIGELPTTLLQDIPQRDEFVQIDFSRYPRRIFPQPDLFHLPLLTSSIIVNIMFVSARRFADWKTAQIHPQ